MERKKAVKEKAIESEEAWPVILRPSLMAITLQLMPLLIGIITLYYLLGYLSIHLPSPVFSFLFKHYNVFYDIVRVLLLLEIIRRYFNHLYYFDKNRITHRSGRVSFNLRVSVVKYLDVREIKVKQNILGRMFKFGNIEIATASTDDAEIELKDVALPKRIAKWVHEVRAKKTKEQGLTGRKEFVD
ncbi:PH domain-containing protein [Oligoflexia bacterium]|nr:PH domain-containing protein [Oligoflexia bacterium]